MNKSQEAFEKWWLSLEANKEGYFARDGWQAAIEWHKLYVHDSLNKLRVYDIDPDRYIMGYNEALDDAITAITEQP